MAARVGRGCVIADQACDLLPARPCGLGRRPSLEEGILWRDLPFEQLWRPRLMLGSVALVSTFARIE